MRARVIHIITKLELGGAQQNTLYTVEHLDRENFSVALWSGEGGILTEDARAIPDLDFVLIPDLVREINPVRDLKALFHLRRLLADEVARSQVPVIVHTHSSKAGILGRWAAWAARAPHIIHTFHGFGFNDYQSLPVRLAYIWAERAAGKVTDAGITVSEANLEKAVNLEIMPPRRLQVIRSGIRIPEFKARPFDREQKKRSLGLAPEAPLALMVACLKPQKNPVDFVRVAERVLEKVPDAGFAVAGDGELRPAMANAIREAGLEDKVKLLGWRRDVPELMWSANVLVLTSLWEGLPRVYPQAAAAGLPIVGTRVDGGAEAVMDGVNGWLVSPGDVDGIAAYVIELLKNPASARDMGLAGRQILPEFDIDLMVEKQQDLYFSLLSGAGESTGG